MSILAEVGFEQEDALGAAFERFTSVEAARFFGLAPNDTNDTPDPQTPGDLSRSY